MSILKDVASTIEDRINESRRELREIARKYISEGGRFYDREKPAKESKPKDTFRAVNATDSQHAQQYFEGLAAIFSEKWSGRDVSTPKYILGFTPISIPPGQEYEIVARSQLDFQPEYLLIPECVSEGIQVCDLKFGCYSQFIACCEIPAVTFSENFPLNRFKMDSCSRSTPITLRVRNTNAFGKNFTAVIVGVPHDCDSRKSICVDGKQYYWNFEEGVLTINPIVGSTTAYIIKPVSEIRAELEVGNSNYVKDYIQKCIPKGKIVSEFERENKNV